MIKTEVIAYGPESAQQYAELHASVFGQDYPVNHPSLVILVREDRQVVGFLSGIWTEVGRFYVQRTGIPQMMCGGRRSVEYWHLVERHLFAIGAGHLAGSIEADNIVPLLVALKTGWCITGTDFENGKLYVRIGKDLTEETTNGE